MARLEVTGAPFKLEKPLSPQSSERCSSPLLQNSTRTDKPVASAASQLRILREMPTVVASPVNEELATTEELAESVRHESSVAAEPAVAHHSQHHLQALSSLDCALSQVGRNMPAGNVWHELCKCCLLEDYPRTLLHTSIVQMTCQG